MSILEKRKFNKINILCPSVIMLVKNYLHLHISSQTSSPENHRICLSDHNTPPSLTPRHLQACLLLGAPTSDLFPCQESQPHPCLRPGHRTHASLSELLLILRSWASAPYPLWHLDGAPRRGSRREGLQGPERENLELEDNPYSLFTTCNTLI